MKLAGLSHSTRWVRGAGPLVLAAIIGVSSCGGGAEPPKPAKQPEPVKEGSSAQDAGQAQTPAAPSAPGTGKEAAPAAPRPGPEKAAAAAPISKEDYFYNPSGRRDPFMSLLVLEKESQRAYLAGDIPPLERHAIPEMRVIGIVHGPSGYAAMLEMPDGRGYSVREGSIVGRNKGVVRRIEKGSVVIEETLKTRMGELQQRKYTLELHKKEEVPQP